VLVVWFQAWTPVAARAGVGGGPVDTLAAPSDTLAAPVPAVPVVPPVRPDTAGVGRADSLAAPLFEHRGLREGSLGAAGGAAEAAGPAAAEQPGERKPPNVWWTTIRSGIVPGWGQMVNHKPLKAALLFGTWSALGVAAWGAEQDRRDAEAALGDSDDPALVAEVNDAVDRRNQFYWFMGLTALYSMIDAYVDVHFWSYEEEWSAVVAPGPGGPVLALSARF
jgi:hypothetical protein